MPELVKPRFHLGEVQRSHLLALDGEVPLGRARWHPVRWRTLGWHTTEFPPCVVEEDGLVALRVALVGGGRGHAAEGAVYLGVHAARAAGRGGLYGRPLKVGGFAGRDRGIPNLDDVAALLATNTEDLAVDLLVGDRVLGAATLAYDLHCVV
ncbi:MAG: hypothetical protein WCJ30_27905, partial [Deltaproteobacteria bacterium]